MWQLFSLEISSISNCVEEGRNVAVCGKVGLIMGIPKTPSNEVYLVTYSQRVGQDDSANTVKEDGKGTEESAMNSE